jgi:P63C domain
LARKSDDELAKKAASNGGKARAKRLSGSKRSEIARQAALSRWGSNAVAAISDGGLRFGEQEIRCAVLGDKRRVLSQQTVLQTLGRARSAKGGTGSEAGGLPPFLAAGNLQEFIGDDLREMLEPIPYRPLTGGRAWGYRAEILPMVCDVYLAARKAGKTSKAQEATAETCEMLVRSLAKVGIIALVDEATGYQEVRARDELQQILSYYVQEELQPWTKTFPDEFFRQIYRLQDWEYRPGTAKRTPYVGKLINKYIYDQLPPGVLDELRELNPVTDKGWRRHKHFQYLTSETGNKHLDRQISTVTTLMRIAEDKEQFEDLFEKAFPPPQQRLPLVVTSDA